MESLLAQESNTRKGGDLRESLCYYLSIIFVLVAVICSFVSLGFCNASTIQAKLYTYKFHFFDKFITFTPGTPVHIDRYGNVFPGAGTTIYLNITDDVREKHMRNVKLRELNSFMTLAVYNGGATAFRGSWDISEHAVQEIDLPKIGNDDRVVSDVIKLTNERFIVVSPTEFLPLTVPVTRDENGKIKVDIIPGTPIKLENDDDKWPHVDRLSNTTFALSYENGYSVYARIGTWKGEGTSASFELTAPINAFTRFSFHGVAGIDENHFIMAVTGSYNQTQGTWPIVAACLATIEGNDIKFGSWKTLSFTWSHNFFDMDNFGRDDVIMIFSESSNAAIHAVMINYDAEKNDIDFGSHRTIQNGGAVLDYNKIDLRVLSPTSFAVFYEDNAIERLVLVMCAISQTKDIVITSPKLIITTGRGYRDRHRTWYDICDSGYGDFNMIEYTEVGIERPRHFVRVHKGVVQARLFGITQKVKKDHVEIQFAGMFTAPKGKTFTPGRAIYTNSKGELVQGSPYGYANRDFGHFYQYNWEKQEIYMNSNLVGMAVTKRKIYMKY